MRVGDRSCLTPTCKLDLKPGQYQIEAKLDGYVPVERNLTIDSGKQIAPVILMMRPVPTPSPPPGTTAAATGKLIVNTGQPDALVFVDSVLRGRTDRRGVFSAQVEVGRHHYEWRNLDIKPLSSNSTWPPRGFPQYYGPQLPRSRQ